LPGEVPFAIFEQHKRPLETSEFQKDRRMIEDADEIPQEEVGKMGFTRWNYISKKLLDQWYRLLLSW